MDNGYELYAGIWLPRSLHEGETARALALLRGYFAPLRGVNTGYTGGQWDVFDPSGERESTPNFFTSDDLLSCALLSAEIGGRAAYDLLVGRADHFAERLAAVQEDVDLADLAEADFLAAFAPVKNLYAALKDLHGVGETRATKLIARKRPRLVPIVDQVVKRTVFRGLPSQWEPLHSALREDDGALHKRLVALRDEAGLPAAVSATRVFDVLAWLEGSKKADGLIRQGSGAARAHSEPPGS